MKKLSVLLLALVLAINVFAQKTNIAINALSTDEQLLYSSGPSMPFMIAIRGNWGYRDYALVTNISTSTSTSNILSVNAGAAGLTLSYNAFLNTIPCYTLGYVNVTVVAYDSNRKAYKSVEIHLNSIFYYDYPINNSCRYYEYYIPDNAWQYLMVPGPMNL